MKGQKWKFLIRIFCILVIAFLCFYTSEQRKINQEEEANRKQAASYVKGKKITRAIPGGMVVGVYAKTQGVLVLEDAKLLCDDGEYRSPSKNILQQGDYIIACDGVKITSKEALIDYVEKSDGQAIKIKIRRNKKEKQVVVTPVLQDGVYKLGVWVRDDIAGLGTMTFITEDMAYGALGHCISDMDLGIEVDMAYGSIHSCKITDIRKGKKNQVGAVIGYINYAPQKPLATIDENSKNGIFGTINELPKEMIEEEYLPIGDSDEINIGDASIISNISGKRRSYSIRIIYINHFSKNKTKNMMIEITDEELLKLTGGIVQGMSGSPIIQDGKIIGALTHVFVNEPTKGYGIFINSMLEK